MAKDVRITPADGTIIFNNSVGSGSGKLEQSGDDLVLSNAVGDVLFGDVDSDVYIGDGVNNVDLIFEQNGSIRGESGNTVTLTVGSDETTLHLTGSTLALQKDGGNVGIGTTSPSYKLDVSGDIRATGDLRADDDVFIAGNTLRFTNDAASAYIQSVDTLYLEADSDSDDGAASKPIIFRTAGTERARLAGNGRLGIGTDSPTQKFEVRGGSMMLSGSYPKFLFEDPSLTYTHDLQLRPIGSGQLEYRFGGGVKVYFNGHSIRFGDYDAGTGTLASSQDPRISKSGTGDDIGNLVFTTNNTSRMFISGSGFVGIGTDSPDTLLHVKGDSKISGSLLIEGGGDTTYGTDSHNACIAMARGSRGLSGEFGSGYYRNLIESNGNATITVGDNTSLISEIRIQTGNSSANGVTTFYNSGSEAMRIHSNKRVGIGTTSPAALLDVNGTAQMSTGITENTHYVGTSLAHWGDGDTNIAFDTDSMTFKAGNVEFLKLSEGLSDQLIINEAGASVDVRIEGDTDTNLIRTDAANDRVGIGQGSPSYKLDVSGDIRATGALGVGVAPNSTDGRIDASNDIVAYSTSDRRLKENITPIENALDKVHEIQGVEFDWKPLQEEEVRTVHGNTGHDIGVIAQEIESILPEAVTTRENGYKAVRYEKIVPLLIQAVKEQQDQINELKDIINGLNS